MSTTFDRGGDPGAPARSSLPDVWQGDDLPDVWDGELPAEPVSSVDLPASRGDQSEGALNELYGGIETRRFDPETPRPHSASGRHTHGASDSASTLLIGHVVVPGATIAMVSSLLFFLYDVRSVYLPGSLHLKWIGFCFVFATVLIARYGRMAGGVIPPKAYAILLAGATVVTMGVSPWEAPEVGILGPLTNGLIIAATWRFANSLTLSLSSDLTAEQDDRQQLYGLEKLEMQRLRRQRVDGPTSVYELGRRAAEARRNDSNVADPERAFRSVARLVVIGFLVFAFGEPALLAGHAAAAERALGAMIVFLLSSAVVLAAASSLRNLERLKALGADGTVAGLSNRLISTALLMVILLSLALATPGVQFRGRGEISALLPTGAQGSDRGADQDAELEEPERAKEAESSRDNRRQSSENETSSSRAEQPSQAESASKVVNLLASLAGKLRLPALVLVALLVLYAAWRLLPGFLNLLTSGALVALWASIWTDLRRRLSLRFPAFANGARSAPSKPRVGLSEAFGDVRDLARLEPRLAVLIAYDRMLAVWHSCGYEPPDQQTPTERVATLPPGLRSIHDPCRRLTEIYVHSAFSDSATTDSDRQAVILTLGEIRQQMTTGASPEL